MGSRPRQVRPPPIAYSQGIHQTARPGWKDARPQVPGSPRKTVICHACYGRGHYSPDCPLTVRQLYEVIRNYEALSVENRNRVPNTAYLSAKARFAVSANATQNSRPRAPATSTVQPAPRQNDAPPRVLTRATGDPDKQEN